MHFCRQMEGLHLSLWNLESVAPSDPARNEVFRISCINHAVRTDPLHQSNLRRALLRKEAGVAISRNRAHIPFVADKHPKGQHNPSQKSLQRWDNEGGAIKGVRAKQPRDPSQKPAHSPGKRSPARVRRD
jgi:hypothetical protein